VNKTCKVSVTFTPTTLGALSDTLSFTDNATGSPQTVSVSGTGEVQASLTPASHTFPKTKVGDTSAAYKFTLKNNLPTTRTGISYSTTAPFAVSTSTCGTTLDSKESCTISVTFSPTATGKATGTLSVSDSANNSPQTASLAGTGDMPGPAPLRELMFDERKHRTVDSHALKIPQRGGIYTNGERRFSILR
jgi:trimeric autotransporter adhesin